MRGERPAEGFVVTELVASVAVLLVPVLLLVGSLPRWSELRHGAIVAAREAAARQVEEWPADARADARDVGLMIATTYGADPRTTEVSVASEDHRGGDVVARVTVTLPAMSIFGLVSAGSWRWTAEARRRIDDYRSR